MCCSEGAQNVRDGANNKLVVAAFERLREIVADHLWIIEMVRRVEWFERRHDLVSKIWNYPRQRQPF